MIVQNLHRLDPEQLRQVAQGLMAEVAERSATIARNERELAFKQATIDKLTHEMAVLKRLKFAAKSEAFSAEQKSLIEETIDTDLAALALQIEQREPCKSNSDKQQPKRAALPSDLPRTEHHHEPDSTTCRCGCQLKRIGQDVAEKLDYAPGVFTVERHVRGKWVCTQCETLVQAAVAPHIIDKGIPTTGLLAQVLVAKYQDHLPLYRQEHIFGRAGLAIPRSTLATWVGQCGVQLQPLVDALKAVMLNRAVLHVDETPVAMLKPGNKKTHKAYIWTYCTTSYDELKAVVFDFAEGRGGQYVRDFLGLHGNAGQDGWHGKLVCDDFSGYKACFELGVTEVGCLAHARRKFHELWVNHGSQVGERALKFFQELYDIEREVQDLQPDERRRIRQERSKDVAKALHQWLQQQRQLVPNGSATAKAIDYSLKRWLALTRFIDHGDLPADNNWVENQIRPIAIGRQADHKLSPSIEPMKLGLSSDAQAVRRLLRGEETVQYPSLPPYAEGLCFESRVTRYRDMLGLDSAVFIPLYGLMGLVALAWFNLVALRTGSWVWSHGRWPPRRLMAWSVASLLCLIGLAVLDARENRAAQHVLDLAIGQPSATSAAGLAFDTAVRDMRMASLQKWFAAAAWAATLAVLAWRQRGELARAGGNGGRARWSLCVATLLAGIGILAALSLCVGSALGPFVSSVAAVSAVAKLLGVGFGAVFGYGLVLCVLHGLLLPSRPPASEPIQHEKGEKKISSPGPPPS